MSGAERGGLLLELDVAGGAVRGFQLGPRSSANVAHTLFRGRPADEVLQLVPLLFSLCRHAQAHAATEALRAAAGLDSGPGAAARRLAVAVEAFDQHMQAALLDWPEAAGLARRTEPYIAVRRWAARVPGLSPEAAAEAVAKLRALFAQEVMTPEAFAEGEGPLGPVARYLVAAGLDRVGDAPVRLEPAPPLETIIAGLERDDRFCLLPRLDGGPAEIGPLAAAASHPAVERAGCGVLGRLVARMLDAEARLDAAEREVERLCAQAWPSAGHAAKPEAGPPSFASVSGTGLGHARTARGQLVHRVQLEQGRVLRWDVVAPTEWNLHPRGALASLLGRPEDKAEAAASWLLRALDPCVPFLVRTRG